jgi:hypothetical protein
MPVSSIGYVLDAKKLRELTLVVVEAHIETRLLILDFRAFFVRAPCFDTSVVTYNPFDYTDMCFVIVTQKLSVFSWFAGEVPTMKDCKKI